MRTLNLNKVDAAAEKYLETLKAENLLSNHDMIVFTDEYKFRPANSSLVKMSENPPHILRAWRIGSTGALFVA